MLFGFGLCVTLRASAKSEIYASDSREEHVPFRKGIPEVSHYTGSNHHDYEEHRQQRADHGFFGAQGRLRQRAAQGWQQKVCGGAVKSLEGGSPHPGQLLRSLCAGMERACKFWRSLASAEHQNLHEATRHRVG